MTKNGDLYVRFGVETKTLIAKVAESLGVSQADYIRYTIKQDLKKRGLLKEAAELPVSGAPNGRCNA
jgi:uncharacterized ubiquitin-like protein YukD